MFNHLFVSIWAQILYFGLCSDTTLFCFSNISSIGHWELSQLVPVSYPHGCFTFCWFVCLFVWALLYILALQNAPGSSIFCSRPRISNFSKEPFVYRSSMLPHALAVLFSHMVVIFLFLPLSCSLSVPHVAPSLTFLLSHSLLYVRVSVYFQRQRVIYLNTQSTPEQKNRDMKVFSPHNKKNATGSKTLMSDLRKLLKPLGQRCCKDIDV